MSRNFKYYVVRNTFFMKANNFNKFKYFVIRNTFLKKAKNIN